VAPYDDVYVAWERLSRDSHIGMSDAFRIVEAVANSAGGRLALAEILAEEGRLAIIEPDALSYLRISRDLPLPPGIDDHRADAYFRSRLYTGTRQSTTHGVDNPKQFLYFNFAIVMLVGTLDDTAQVREKMRRSGQHPVVVRMGGGVEKAIGIVMVNEFRDTTFGPYNELIFMATSVPEDAPRNVAAIDYVNPYSLQIPLDQGAAVYVFKLWLNELAPIDGGNDYLGTNKELGCFRFEDRDDGTRTFRGWDKDLKALISGSVPRTMTAEGTRAAQSAYLEAARRAGTTVPTSTVATIPVASRPDDDVDKPATIWAFAVDWRRCILQEVAPSQVGLCFGDSAWARWFEALRFTPALSFYAPSGVGQILQRIGDSPFNPAGVGAEIQVPLDRGLVRVRQGTNPAGARTPRY
jgi:hypothetical protein